MRILNLNKLSQGTLTWSSQLEKYPFVTAFADTALSVWGKFATNNGQYMQVSYATATPIYYAAILNTNFSASATIQLQCSNDNFSTISETHNLANYNTDWYYRNDAGLNYKAYRFCVTDTSVTYPRLSKIFIGGYTQMPGMTEVSRTIKSNAKTGKSDSGQQYGYKVVQLKQYAVTFDLVNGTTKTAIEKWFSDYDKTTPCPVILYEDTPNIEPPCYMTMTGDLEWKTVITSSEQYQLSIKTEECK